MNWRSVWAIVAGILFVIVVTTIVDIIMHVVGVFPAMGQPLTDMMCVIATSYRIVIGVAGAWLTAWLAPTEPMKHAMILGVVGLLLGIVGVVVTWNMGLGPFWYPVALAVLAIPQCWLGGKLYVAQTGRS